MIKMVPIDKDKLHSLLYPDDSPHEHVWIECAIALGSNARSSKTIRRTKSGKIQVYNLIDDTMMTFGTFDAMLSRTNIGEAIEKKILYLYVSNTDKSPDEDNEGKLMFRKKTNCGEMIFAHTEEAAAEALIRHEQECRGKSIRRWDTMICKEGHTKALADVLKKGSKKEITKLREAREIANIHRQYIEWLEMMLERAAHATQKKYHSVCNKCGGSFDRFGTKCTCHDLRVFPYEGILYPDGTITIAAAFKGGDTVKLSMGMISYVSLSRGVQEKIITDKTYVTIYLNDGTEIVVLADNLPEEIRKAIDGYGEKGAI